MSEPSARIGIVGLGAVGARLVRRLEAAEPGSTVGIGRDAGEWNLDAGDVVVLAGPRPHAPLAQRALARGCHVVSVGDDVDDVRDLLSLGAEAAEHGRVLVVGAAGAPGLTGLLARHLADRLDVLDEIHVAMHGTGGPACARQHHRQLAGTALGWHDGTWIERPAGSGRELCWFPEPLGAWDCYRAGLVDPILLVRAFPSVARVSARMSANRRDRLTARLPMLSPPHREGGLGGLRVEVRGSRDGERVTVVAGVAERAAVVTAATAAAFVVALRHGQLGPGVVVPGSADVPTRDVLHEIRATGIALREFVGSEAVTAW